MGFIGKIINQSIADNVREIVTELFDGYTRVSDQVLPPGIDAAPLPEDQGVSLVIDKAGRSVNIGIYPDVQVKPGEIRIYSRDTDRNIKALIYLKDDGNIEINGSDDNAVRFSKLKEVADEIKQDITNLKNAFTSWTPVPQDGGAALKTASATWAGTALAKNIDDSKVKTIKLPGA